MSLIRDLFTIAKANWKTTPPPPAGMHDLNSLGCTAFGDLETCQACAHEFTHNDHYGYISDIKDFPIALTIDGRVYLRIEHCLLCAAFHIRYRFFARNAWDVAEMNAVINTHEGK